MKNLADLADMCPTMQIDNLQIDKLQIDNQPKTFIS